VRILRRRAATLHAVPWITLVKVASIVENDEVMISFQRSFGPRRFSVSVSMKVCTARALSEKFWLSRRRAKCFN
jgi:hypothetical protein